MMIGVNCNASLPDHLISRVNSTPFVGSSFQLVNMISGGLMLRASFAAS